MAIAKKNLLASLLRVPGFATPDGLFLVHTLQIMKISAKYTQCNLANRTAVAMKMEVSMIKHVTALKAHIFMVIELYHQMPVALQSKCVILLSIFIKLVRLLMEK